MTNLIGKIKIRQLEELRSQPPPTMTNGTNINDGSSSDSDFEEAPKKQTTIRQKKRSSRKKENMTKEKALTTIKKSKESSKNKLLSGQKLLSQYYKTCTKNFQIPAETTSTTCKETRITKESSAAREKGKPRKRLFEDLETRSASIVDLCLSTDDEILGNDKVKNTEKAAMNKQTEAKNCESPGRSRGKKTNKTVAKKAEPKKRKSVSAGRNRKAKIGQLNLENSSEDSEPDVDMDKLVLERSHMVLRRKRVERFYIETSSSASDSESKIRNPSLRSSKTKVSTSVIEQNDEIIKISSEDIVLRVASPSKSHMSKKAYASPCKSVKSCDDDLVCYKDVATQVTQRGGAEEDTASSEKSKDKNKENKNENGEQQPSIVFKTDTSEVASSWFYDLTCQTDSDDDNQLKENKFENANEQNTKTSKKPANRKTVKKNEKVSKPKPPCPPYKVIKGTSFAVDAFRYGLIEGVTHYFLTHFHADHYIGLTRKFSMPLYMSPITARLVRTFIPIAEEFIHEIELEKPLMINDIEVTAIDANHCPGAIMLVFKFSNGECTLHTGDFRASSLMESEPIFWNNDIHRIYLDTTYLPSKYEMYSQDESFDRALDLMTQFEEQNSDCKILYIVGAYLIGKERFWSFLAHQFNFKVWTEPKRKTALLAMNIEEYSELLTDDPLEAQMHVLSVNALNYQSLVQYLDRVKSHFDVIFAIRPSGWEKNTRPQMRGKINIVGIQYSEHSAYQELQRFIRFLKPNEVLSTVPCGRDLMVTPKVPLNWYKYEKLSDFRTGYQPSITSYMKLRSVTQAITTKEPIRRKNKNTEVPNTENSVLSGGDFNISTVMVSPMKSLNNSGNGMPEKYLSTKNVEFENMELADDNDWMS